MSGVTALGCVRKTSKTTRAVERHQRAALDHELREGAAPGAGRHAVRRRAQRAVVEEPPVVAVAEHDDVEARREPSARDVRVADDRVRELVLGEEPLCPRALDGAGAAGMNGKARRRSSLMSARGTSCTRTGVNPRRAASSSICRCAAALRIGRRKVPRRKVT